MRIIERPLDAAGIVGWRLAEAADSEVGVKWLPCGDGLDLPTPSETIRLVDETDHRVRLLRLAEHVRRFDGPVCARGFTVAAANGSVPLAGRLFDAWMASRSLTPRLHARAVRSILIHQRRARCALMPMRRWPAGVLHLHDMPAGVALLAVRPRRGLWPQQRLILRTAGDAVEAGPLWWSIDARGRASRLD